eukprot:6186953-Pleurochrysis_carterae.AAC.3
MPLRTHVSAYKSAASILRCVRPKPWSCPPVVSITKALELPPSSSRLPKPWSCPPAHPCTRDARADLHSIPSDRPFRQERDYLNMLGSAARLGVSLDPRRVAITACATPSSSVVGVTPNTAAISCLQKMVDDGVRQLPVIAPVATTPAGSTSGAHASAVADADATDSPRGMLVAMLTMRDVLAHFLPGSG